METNFDLFIFVGSFRSLIRREKMEDTTKKMIFEFIFGLFFLHFQRNFSSLAAKKCHGRNSLPLFENLHYVQ
jgi:hypothetical protein